MAMCCKWAITVIIVTKAVLFPKFKFKSFASI
uniref:Uncharacterized protein n=1 Tax=Rhizophora mucronata TaxID=61149 RepID=A0A2P2PZ51_RHIMU